MAHIDELSTLITLLASRSRLMALFIMIALGCCVSPTITAMFSLHVPAHAPRLS